MLLARCVPPFYSIFIALVSIGRRQIYRTPNDKPNWIKNHTVIDWSVSPERTCKFFFLFFLELINGSLFCFYWTNKYDFFFNSWDELNWKHYRLVSNVRVSFLFFLILISTRLKRITSFAFIENRYVSLKYIYI